MTDKEKIAELENRISRLEYSLECVRAGIERRPPMLTDDMKTIQSKIEKETMEALSNNRKIYSDINGSFRNTTR